MGMKEDLQQVQESRTMGKEPSTVVDPGPFGDIVPLDEPEKKDAEKEPEEEERKDEGEEEKEEEAHEEEEGKGDEEDEEVPPEKLQTALKQYKTREEAAAAAYRFQKASTVSAVEAARLRKEIEDLKRAGTYTPPPPPVIPKPEIPIEDAIADKYFADIARLPEDEPDRDKKVVRLMAKMQAEITDAKRLESERKDKEVDHHIKGVEARAKELGLEEGLLEDFWIYAGVAPKYLQKDDAIKWSIERVNRLKGDKEAIKEETLEKARKDEQEKKRMAPLGKGSLKPVARKPEEEPNLSLGDTLRELNRQRVYK